MAWIQFCSHTYITALHKRTLKQMHFLKLSKMHSTGFCKPAQCSTPLQHVTESNLSRNTKFKLEIRGMPSLAQAGCMKTLRNCITDARHYLIFSGVSLATLLSPPDSLTKACRSRSSSNSLKSLICCRSAFISVSCFWGLHLSGDSTSCKTCKKLNPFSPCEVLAYC